MASKRRSILSALIIVMVVAFVLGSAMVIIMRFLSPASAPFFSEKIGVIPVEGTITSSQTITSHLIKFRKDPDIKAIILKINSSGGGIAPSQEIYREIERTVPVKKVVAFMGSVAASGGYYIAAAADRIVASPGTITGSIGVIMEFLRLEDLLNKLGVDLEVVKSGEFKDMGSPDRKLTEKEREMLKDMVMDMQNQFVEAIVRGRRLPLEQVQQIADGRVFSGARAKELGLVDVLGNFEDAVELTKDLAGIKGEASLVYAKKSPLEALDLLIKTGVRSIAGALHHPEGGIAYRWAGVSGPPVTENN
ncbi:MAG: signal peptide peptidase SppA [Deltaproteobacteria bacterium]|nr:signal peptide peptidase SppA [Deltaproteobacteria bacterium]